LQHEKRGSVYAYKRELDAWLESKKHLIEPKPGNAGSRRDRKLWLAVAATALMAVVLGAWWTARSPRFGRPSFSSIAVLPFENLSHNPAEEWFSDGIPRP
jgi:hypothetical protein